jgi:hypothetical protein
MRKAKNGMRFSNISNLPQSPLISDTLKTIPDQWGNCN